MYSVHYLHLIILLALLNQIKKTSIVYIKINPDYNFRNMQQPENFIELIACMNKHLNQRNYAMYATFLIQVFSCFFLEKLIHLKYNISTYEFDF